MSDQKLNLVCSSCLSVNRVAADRFGDRPICGKCRHRLLPTSPIELTDQSFDKVVTRSDVPILVDFWASWCGPCRMMAPSFAEAAAALSPQFVLAKLDTDASQHTASRFSLSGIPTIILFQRGAEIARQSGAMNTDQIIRWATGSMR